MGGAFIFVSLLAMTIILTVAVWIFMSRCVVLIVEDTANGNEEIIWGDEPVLDWIWMGGYIAWLTGVWLAPAAIVARMATPHMPLHDKAWVYLGFLFGTFWLTFPISLLSTMSAESRWAIFHPGLIRRLAANLGQVVIFYLVSALIVGICFPMTVGVGMGSDPLTLILGSLGLGASVILLSRMLGRLACLARLTEIRPKTRRRAKPPASGVSADDPWGVPDEPEEQFEAVVAEEEKPHFIQPEDLPPLQTPYDGEITGYNVNFDAKPTEKPPMKKRKRKRPVPMRADADAQREIAREWNESRERASTIVSDAIEMDRLQRKKIRIIKRPPLAGLGFFLMQKDVAINWVILSIGFGILGLCARGLLMMKPE